MKLPWFRMYAEAVDDDKLRLLAYEDRWHFVAIMCCMGQGILDSPPDLMRRKVAVKLGLDSRELDEVARRLSEVGLIDRNSLKPLAWDRRQFISDADNTAAERQRRRREKLKESNSKSTVTDVSRVTSRTCHGRVTRPDTDTDTDTDADEENKTPPARKRAGSRSQVERPDDVSEQTWADFLELRKSKRAPLTATALAGIAREADKAGMSLQDAIALCCERGWQSINARWISEKSSGPYTGGANGNGGGAGDWKEGWWHPVYDTPEEYIRSGWEIGQAERAAKRKQWEK